MNGNGNGLTSSIRQKGSLISSKNLQTVKLGRNSISPHNVVTNTNNTTVYTCPTGATAILKSILVTEDGNTGTNISITLTTSGSAVFNLFKSKAISANSTVELLSRDLLLTAGDILKVQAATANRLHVVASITEIPG